MLQPAARRRSAGRRDSIRGIREVNDLGSVSAEHLTGDHRTPSSYIRLHIARLLSLGDLAPQTETLPAGPIRLGPSVWRHSRTLAHSSRLRAAIAGSAIATRLLRAHADRTMRRAAFYLFMVLLTAACSPLSPHPVLDCSAPKDDSCMAVLSAAALRFPGAARLQMSSRQPPPNYLYAVWYVDATFANGTSRTIHCRYWPPGSPINCAFETPP
jgi:hypothetical protein